VFEAAVAMTSRLDPAAQGSTSAAASGIALPPVRLPDMPAQIEALIGKARTIRLLMLAYHADFNRKRKRISLLQSIVMDCSIFHVLSGLNTCCCSAVDFGRNCIISIAS
jgi:hypothetical protein